MKILNYLLLLCLFAPLTWAANRPNVIIILTDDQGYGDLSCHGNPVLKTPNLDKLHDQSIRFDDFVLLLFHHSIDPTPGSIIPVAGNSRIVYPRPDRSQLNRRPIAVCNQGKSP